MQLELFTQLSIILALVVGISLIMRRLKQPLIMGYIIAGIVAGPSLLNVVHADGPIHSFSTIGIILLLFIIGLGLNVSVIKSLGRVSIVTCLIVMPVLWSILFVASRLLGFDPQTSVILGLGLIYSSTIIILKVLSDNKETSRLYGQLALGVLLIEDVVATCAMVALTFMSGDKGMDVSTVAFLILKACGLGLLLYIAGGKIMPKLTRHAARNQETLFLFAIGWAFLVASLFDMAGFSHEVGALFAGVSLASLPYATEMAAKLKPLRDFFIVIFFVGLGSAFTVGSIQNNFLAAHVFALIILLIKPLLVIIGLTVQNHTKLTSFRTGVQLSQISEFSIVFITLAAQEKIISPDVTAMVTLVAFITIGASTYLNKHSTKIYRFIEKPLRKLERKNAREKRKRSVTYPIILFGYHKGGHEFVSAFREMKQRYLVVDYNPEIIDQLETQGIRHAYGDMTDEEFLDEIDAVAAELIVSTVDVVEINLITLKYIRRRNPNVSFVCHATSYADADVLYRHGASYVSIPHYIGSERVSTFIKRRGISHDALALYRNKHLVTIGKRVIHVAKKN